MSSVIDKFKAIDKTPVDEAVVVVEAYRETFEFLYEELTDLLSKSITPGQNVRGFLSIMPTQENSVLMKTFIKSLTVSDIPYFYRFYLESTLIKGAINKLKIAIDQKEIMSELKSAVDEILNIVLTEVNNFCPRVKRDMLLYKSERPISAVFKINDGELLEPLKSNIVLIRDEIAIEYNEVVNKTTKINRKDGTEDDRGTVVRIDS